jgi:hypothetical protein
MREGLHDVAITKIEDLGLQELQSGTKDVAAIHFTADDDSLRHSDVCLKVSTQGFHPKSNLAKLLTQLGFSLGDTFDLSNLVGIKCQVLVQHRERDGKTYANVAAVLKIPNRTVIRCGPAK